MSEKELDNYMFLGLPGTGKTTFFCSMADYLQEVTNSQKNISLQVKNKVTQNYIEEAMNKLRHQEWPDKTQNKLSEDLKLSLMVGSSGNYDFVFHDYPGEAFYEAFIDDGEGNFAEDANDLKKRLTSTSGIFLLLSVESLLNDEEYNIRSNVIGEMLRFISKNNREAKIAILFSKVELCYEYDHDEMVKKFFKQYKIVAGWIKSFEKRCKFFTVKPLGHPCVINEEGKCVPPPEIYSEGLREPIEWITGLTFDNRVLVEHIKRETVECVIRPISSCVEYLEKHWLLTSFAIGFIVAFFEITGLIVILLSPFLYLFYGLFSLFNWIFSLFN